MAEKDWISRYFAPLATPGARKMTDDVGLLETSESWSIVTTDTLVEGVHFLPGRSLAEFACKLVRVNISDILAKGAKPTEALLNLGWPDERAERELADFAGALAQELDIWGIGLVGGDTVSSPNLFATMTLFGCPSFNRAKPVWQDGAVPGDIILVSGRIGGCVGLEDIQLGRETEAGRHFLVPKLPLSESARLISSCASAATDISDGLFADLQQMLSVSGVGGEVSLNSIRYWRESGDAEQLIKQCTGGDDYQIVCTAAPDKAKTLIKSEIFYPIGEVTADRGLSAKFNGTLVNLPETLGFEHGA